MLVKLANKTQLDGSSYEELDLKLEELIGKDLIELEAAFRQIYKTEYIPLVNLDARYNILVAGRVCGINPRDLMELDAPDFVEVCTTVQNYLLRDRDTPFVYKDKDLPSLLKSLKGKHLISMETEFKKKHKGEYIPVANIDARYQATIASKVLEIKIEELEALPAPNFVEVCQTVQGFLLK